MSEKNDYFDYVSTVLGVKSIYLEPNLAETPQTAAAAPVGTKEFIPLLVTVENLPQYSAAEKDLLEKMISALKIDLSKVKVTSAPVDTKQVDYAFLLNFSDTPVPGASGENILTTYSPRVLLKNSSLKKQVWNEFQTIIKFFSN